MTDSVTGSMIRGAYSASSTAGGRLIILVNGPPAAGKTTLGRALSRHLRLPLLSKDVVKEGLANAFPDADDSPARQRQLGAAACEALWALLPDTPAGAVLEAPFTSPEADPWVERGLKRAGLAPGDVVQVWCQVPVGLALERFRARHPTRPAVHGPSPETAAWHARYYGQGPLPLPRTVRVDTTRPVAAAEVVDLLGRALPNGHTPPRR